MDEVSNDVRPRWRPVSGYESYYEVSESGEVRSLPRPGGRVKVRILKPQASKTGYLYLRLNLPCQASRKFYVHRLVAQEFLEKALDAQVQVNHKNGFKDDNHVENLEYCTAKENMVHMTEVLCRNNGARSRAKLTESKVEGILCDSRTLKEIAADHGVSLQAIWLAKQGKTWSKRLRRLEKRMA